jgi:hypothetical protein
MRNAITGLESYMVDWNKYPFPRITADTDPPGGNNNNTPHSCTQFLPGGQHVVNLTPSPTRNPGGSPINGIFMGITTPIAYLSTIPKDVFAVGKWGLDYQDIGYQNMIMLNEFVIAAPGVGENGSNTGSTQFDQAATYGAYIVRSIGPDKQYSPVNNPYDATNGSVSLGDIYRTAKREKNSRSVGGE